jgi:hypothetical protein
VPWVVKVAFRYHTRLRIFSSFSQRVQVRVVFVSCRIVLRTSNAVNTAHHGLSIYCFRWLWATAPLYITRAQGTGAVLSFACCHHKHLQSVNPTQIHHDAEGAIGIQATGIGGGGGGARDSNRNEEENSRSYACPSSAAPPGLVTIGIGDRRESASQLADRCARTSCCS